MRDWIVKNKYWLITHIPALIILSLVWRHIVTIKLMHQYTGYIAVCFLILVLILKPLKITYPNFIFNKLGLGKHKREIGVASFTYAALHAYFYYLKKGSLAKLLPYLVHPIIIPASLIAFPILFVLAITSNNFSTKRLGYVKWKKIHRTVYLAQYAALIHMIMAKERFWAILLFSPLFILQYLKKRTDSLSKAKQANPLKPD